MDLSYIQHHGIKGMRWGIRRFQKKDGTLTPAGRKRRSENTEANSKTTHRDRLEEKYRSRGMSSEEAKLAVDKRIKAEKIVAITAGVTIAAASAYVIARSTSNKKFFEYTKSIKGIPDSLANTRVSDLDDSDIFLPKGTKLHRMSPSSKFDPSSMTYFSYTKKDVDRYRSIYDYIQPSASKYYDQKLKNVVDLKAPSTKKQVETFISLFNDDEFVKNIGQMKFPYSSINSESIKKLLDEGSSRESVAKSLYPLFTNTIGGSKDNPAVKTYVEAIKNKGYNALLDTNDKTLGIADYPLISLNADSDIVQTGSRAVNDFMKMASKLKL